MTRPRSSSIHRAPSRRTTAVLAMAALIVALSPARIAAAEPPVPGVDGLPSHAEDRVILGFDSPRMAVLGRARLDPGVSTASVRLSPLAPDAIVVRLAPGVSVGQAMRELRDQPGVAYVEPDYHVRVAATANDPRYTDGSLWAMYGDDTGPHANRFGTGADIAWRAGHVGRRRVHVGVVDEGIRIDHPDLADNIWTNPSEVVNGADDDGNGYVDDVHGWDFFNDDPTVYDGVADDHGTHVAGTIGAHGGNGIGVAGVNWQITIVPAKFLGPGGGYVSDAVRALDYLTDLKSRHGLDLVATNNSWTGGGFSEALAGAIDRGGDAGILFVAAAGNDGRDVDAAPVYPGGYTCVTPADGGARGWDCVLSVANLRADGERHPDSNRGDERVDLGAPGTSIISTHPQGDGYAYDTGTSMAAAHVTGATALCASRAPARSARWIREALLDTAAPTDSLQDVTVTGGRLDVAALVERCDPPPVVAPTPYPTPAPTPPLQDDPGPIPSPPQAATVFVDDLDPAFKRGGSGWSGVARGYAGHHFRLRTRSDARTSYGAWRPLLSSAGTYRIVAFIPQGASSRAAAYKVRTANGWVTRVRNQHKRQGTWVGLGIHPLTATPSVRLADLTGEPIGWDRHLVYDAIRFVPLDVGGAVDGHVREAPRTHGPPVPR